jgi:hypothetical protein
MAIVENFYADYDYALEYGYGFPYDSPEDCELDGIESIGDKCCDGSYLFNSCFENSFGAGVEKEYARRYFRLKFNFKNW